MSIDRGWVVAGASSRGPSHEEDGTPCQDAFQRRASGSTAIVCVCDGVGSAPKSETGAQTVTAAVIQHIAKALDGGPVNGLEARTALLRAACAAGRDALLARAADLTADPDDLACTTIVVVAWDEEVHVAQIGDGAVVVRSSGGLQVLSAPDNSEYANETYALSSSSWEDHLRSSRAADVSAFAAFTDGCQRASLVAAGRPTPFVAFWDPVFEFVQSATGAAADDDEIRSLLDGARMRATSRDDKTLVVAVRREAACAQPAETPPPRMIESLP